MYNFVALSGTVYSPIFASALVGEMCTFWQNIIVVFGGTERNFPLVGVEFALFPEPCESK